MVSLSGKRLESNLNRKPKFYVCTDILVHAIAHWTGPEMHVSLDVMSKADWSM